jgi:CDP-diacylglycerol--glycerol-3-phosphate 3-phosphatidyltransferase
VGPRAKGARRPESVYRHAVVPEHESDLSAPPRDLTAKRARRRSLAEDALNLPNLITFARILMIPACLALLQSNTPRGCFFAALVFTFAALTDALDGYLARKMGIVSVLGKFMDPLADKLIVMASLIYLVPLGRVPAWVVVVILGRDITITGLRSVAASEGVVISAGQEGKTKTALQMVGVIAILVGFPYPMRYLGFIDLGIVDLARVGRGLVYLSLFFSLASAIDYMRIFGAAVEAKDKKLAKERASTSDLSPESDVGPS